MISMVLFLSRLLISLITFRLAHRLKDRSRVPFPERPGIAGSECRRSIRPAGIKSTFFPLMGKRSGSPDI